MCSRVFSSVNGFETELTYSNALDQALPEAGLHWVGFRLMQALFLVMPWIRHYQKQACTTFWPHAGPCSGDALDKERSW
jgi:hypothetical protein